MTFPPEVWDVVLRRLRDELAPFAYEAWLQPLIPEPTGETSDQLRLLCPSLFHRDRIRDRHLNRICELLESELGRKIKVDLEIAGPARTVMARVTAPSANGSAVSLAKPHPERTARTIPLDRERKRVSQQRSFDYSFDNFVVGPCNALAREASFAIAREEQQTLNQLYLNSPPGMGKTHLSRAVAAEARRLGERRVLYTSAESFTNDFMSAIRSGQMTRFKQRYRRECELFVLEDIQFLAGKRSTQLEFFHTVQHVIDAGGRVILTGDRLPNALVSLEDFVRSQVARGFVAELAAPDAQVRRNILRAKAAAGGVRLPDDCLDLLVATVRGSVRDLESVLIQLVTTSSLLDQPITLALAEEALAKKGASLAPYQRLDVATVIGAVTTFFKTTNDALGSKSRKRDVLVPRQLAMYLCNRYTDASLAEIGRALRRDHPAVRNAITRVERAVLERAPLRYQVEALSKRLDELASTNDRTS